LSVSRRDPFLLLVNGACSFSYLHSTWIPNIGEVVRLQFGEFLLHPGSLLHGGVNITSGNRYLMILFAHYAEA
jgi:hypothetical protein